MPVSKSAIVLAVDLDGVVADLYTTLRPLAAEWLGKDMHLLPEDVSYGLGEWGFSDDAQYLAFHDHAVVEHRVYARLAPIRHAPEVLARLAVGGIRVHIVTHRLVWTQEKEEVAKQTFRWLKDQKIPFGDISFMGDKARIVADYYIDDSPVCIRWLREQQKVVLVFANSTNKGIGGRRFSDWLELEEFLTKGTACV